MARRKRFSRLARKEEARNLRQAILFGFLTITILFLLIFLGIPALIRMAIFLGNLRSSSLPVETGDVLPPAPPVLSSLPPATNSAQIDLHGFAEAGTTVEIFLNKISTSKLVVEKGGTFAVNKFTVTSGRNEIFAEATDDAGNTSQSSEKIIIFYDTEPPKLIISEPEDGASLIGEESPVKILGITEEEARAAINEHLVIVSQEGDFEFSLPLSEGENLIKVVATDQAGNQTEKELTVNYSP